MCTVHISTLLHSGVFSYYHSIEARKCSLLSRLNIFSFLDGFWEGGYWSFEDSLLCVNRPQLFWTLIFTLTYIVLRCFETGENDLLMIQCYVTLGILKLKQKTYFPSKGGENNFWRFNVVWPWVFLSFATKIFSL